MRDISIVDIDEVIGNAERDVVFLVVVVIEEMLLEGT